MACHSEERSDEESLWCRLNRTTVTGILRFAQNDMAEIILLPTLSQMNLGQLELQSLQQAVLGVESSFELAPEQRNRTIYRLDGGSGTDENLRWLLAKGYQVLGKGFSGKRAKVLAAQVSRWGSLR